MRSSRRTLGGGKIPGGEGCYSKGYKRYIDSTTSQQQKKYNSNKQATIQLDPIRTKLSI